MRLSVRAVRAAFAVVIVVVAGGGACPAIDLPFDAGPLPDLPPLSLPPLPELPDLSTLPHPDGNAVLIQISDSRLEIDPTASDAITAVGTCTDLIAYCVAPSRSIETCVAATPTCRTEQPWTEAIPCCPGACHSDFAAAVAAGADPLAAFTDTFFRGATCFPGVADALAGP